MNKAPVALIFYNRPATTRRVMEAIRGYRPDRLYLIADRWPEGDDAVRDLCLRLREEVEASVDWPCAVHKVYAVNHLGCRFRPATGISAVLDREESAIFLEDDCVPVPGFFDFCSVMLDRHRDEASVMMVSGSNRLGYRPPQGADYFFSRYPQIWGWATWSRAWRRYDTSLKDWPSIRERLSDTGLPPSARNLYREKLDEVVFEHLDAWDFGWSLTLATHHGKALVPARNLVSNIGFGPGATHTLNPLGSLFQPRARSLEPPYTPPAGMEIDERHDRLYCRKQFEGIGLPIRERLHRWLKPS